MNSDDRQAAKPIGTTVLALISIMVFLTTAYENLQRSIGILTPVNHSLSPATSAFANLVIASIKT